MHIVNNIYIYIIWPHQRTLATKPLLNGDWLVVFINDCLLMVKFVTCNGDIDMEAEDKSVSFKVSRKSSNIDFEIGFVGFGLLHLTVVSRPNDFWNKKSQ